MYTPEKAPPTNTWSFEGAHVFVGRNLPEFVPKLRLVECGCSEHVRNEFNEYLLKMFGERRHFLVVHGDIYCHPNTFEWFKEQCRD